MIQQILQKIKNLISRAGIIATDDSKKVQTIKIDGPHKGEAHHDVVHHQIYGFSIHAPKGSVPIVIEVNGDRSTLEAINPHHASSRPKGLNEGDVQIYTTAGQYIKLSADGNIAISTTKNIIINCNDITVTADKATINSNNINLGSEGGQPIARVGDMVRVGGGSSAGDWPIVTGSPKAKAT